MRKYKLPLGLLLIVVPLLLITGFFINNNNETKRGDNNVASAAIYYDYTPPAVYAVSEGGTIPNGAYLNLPWVRFEAYDSNSGLGAICIKIPGNSYFTQISYSPVTMSYEGRYEYFAVDRAGNQSYTSFFTVDRTAPIVAAFAGAAHINNYTYINASSVTFKSYDDTAYHYLRQGNSGYMSVANNSVVYAENTYYFYARDRAYNYSQTISVTIDRTAPVGMLYADSKLFTGNDVPVSAGSIRYYASDINPLSVYAKLPGSENYRLISNGTAYYDEGTYLFYSEDRAGNKSEERVITIDRTAPTIELYDHKNAVLENINYTNADYITAGAFDGLSGVRALYVMLPGGEQYLDYLPGVRLYDEGEYAFYAEDMAGNLSETVTVTIDKTPPQGSVFSGGNLLYPGGYTNDEFCYIASDFVSGTVYFEVKKPGLDWEEYIEEMGVTAGAGDGVYVFRSRDKAGNLSEEYFVTLDTIAPTGQLYALERGIDSGGYTNALRIRFAGYDINLKSSYVKLPGSSGYELTGSNAIYSDEGRYEFYALDRAGNVSETYILTVDRLPKELNLTGVLDGLTDTNVTLNWSNIAGLAPIISVTINGYPYVKGNVIKTIDNGCYEITSIDAAGNVWSTVFIAYRQDVETVTYNKFWWEAKDNDGNIYSFDTYDKALSFATSRENSLIRSMVWNNDTWDSGIMMDSIDSVNAKQGTFYLYKKTDNPAVNVAYFTWERLNTVIRQYAELEIDKYYYWQKAPTIVYMGSTVTTLSDEYYIITDSVTLGDAGYIIDGIRITDKVYNVKGEHILTVFDDWGNSYDIRLIVVDSPPALTFRYGNGDYYAAESIQPYYLKNRITLKVTDSLDEFAMGIVKDSSGKIIYLFNLGEELILPESGKYIVQTVNHSGLSVEYVFYISYTAPFITAAESTSAKRLDVTFTPSPDRDIAVEYIRIYRSDNKEEWTLLKSDDYGIEITASRLSYRFYKTACYRFIIEDTCRTGTDVVKYEVYYTKPAPEITLNNLPINGYANEPVSFFWTDEAYAVISFNGEESEYTSGTELTKEGKYIFTFGDYDNYEKSYTFTIDKTAPGANLSIEPVNGFVTDDVSLSIEEECKAHVYLDGELLGEYITGMDITEDGSYIIEVYDLAGNKTSLEFIKDTKPPAAELVGVENGGVVKGIVTLKNVSENVAVEAYLNGERIDYALGDLVKTVGLYRIIITDDAGLITEYNFEILYYLNGASIAVITILAVAVIGSLVGIVMLRKRNRFR